ncbi:unnamed protein product, partial [Mycena citricolor]
RAELNRSSGAATVFSGGHGGFKDADKNLARLAWVSLSAPRACYVSAVQSISQATSLSSNPNPFVRFRSTSTLVGPSFILAPSLVDTANIPVT